MIDHWKQGLALALLATVLACTPAMESGGPVPGGSRQPFVSLEVSPFAISPADVRDVAGFSHRVLPVYPEDAIAAGIDGDVVVQAFIDEAGWPIETRIVKSIPMLDASVVNAVRASSFRPSRNTDGDPIASWISITGRFELP